MHVGTAAVSFLGVCLDLSIGLSRNVAFWCHTLATKYF